MLLRVIDTPQWFRQIPVYRIVACYMVDNMIDGYFKRVLVYAPTPVLKAEALIRYSWEQNKDFCITDIHKCHVTLLGDDVTITHPHIIKDR